MLVIINTTLFSVSSCFAGHSFSESFETLSHQLMLVDPQVSVLHLLLVTAHSPMASATICMLIIAKYVSPGLNYLVSQTNFQLLVCYFQLDTVLFFDCCITDYCIRRVLNHTFIISWFSRARSPGMA